MLLFRKIQEQKKFVHNVCRLGYEFGKNSPKDNANIEHIS